MSRRLGPSRTKPCANRVNMCKILRGKTSGQKKVQKCTADQIKGRVKGSQVRQRDRKWSLRKWLNFCVEGKGHDAHCSPGEKINTESHTNTSTEGHARTHTHSTAEYCRQRYQSINTKVQVSLLLSKERPINAHTAIYLYQSAAPGSSRNPPTSHHSPPTSPSPTFLPDPPA